MMKSRRRIASPKALGPRKLHRMITAGISDRRNGVRPSFCVATIIGTECPLWVNNGHRGKLEECPLYPQKRTSVSVTGMSAKCQTLLDEPGT
jgi:hypothetical protein